MLSRSFLKSGHTPTLFSAFLYFDLSFMVWVILGPLGVAISKTLHLDPGQKGDTAFGQQPDTSFDQRLFQFETGDAIN